VEPEFVSEPAKKNGRKKKASVSDDNVDFLTKKPRCNNGVFNL
jgi:hypothetical protein